MNYALPTLLMLSLSMNACAQKVSEASVPQPVKAAFMKQFPKAEHAKWEMEDGKDYEVNFRLAGTETSAKFNAQGGWLETETSVKEADLPEAVRNALAAQYAGHKISECERVESPEGTAYEVEAEQGETTLEVKFSADGRVLKSTAVEEEDKEERD